jgi:hypothetical protein
LPAKLVHAKPQDQPVHHVHPLEPPVFGGFDDEWIELRGARRDAGGQQRGKQADVFRGCLAGRPVGPEGPADLVNRHATDLPLVEHLERGLACTMPWLGA